MALTKEEHENLLREIAETGGDTANMLELMQKLRDDFDEREGMLRREGEREDRNDPDTRAEEDRIVEESTRDNREDGGLRRDPIRDEVENLRRANEELKRKYIERFFSTPEEAKEDQEEDIKRDGTDQTFDKLFKEREG